MHIMFKMYKTLKISVLFISTYRKLGKSQCNKFLILSYPQREGKIIEEGYSQNGKGSDLDMDQKAIQFFFILIS